MIFYSAAISIKFKLVEIYRELIFLFNSYITANENAFNKNFLFKVFVWFAENYSALFRLKYFKARVLF
jgi:hypothetical protein